jgi:hypothetical protein
MIGTLKEIFKSTTPPLKAGYVGSDRNGLYVGLIPYYRMDESGKCRPKGRGIKPTDGIKCQIKASYR